MSAQGLFLCAADLESSAHMFNRFKTAALLAFLTALFLFTGNLLGGTFGLAIAIVLAIVMNFGTYWFSDRLILRFYRAQQIGADDDPQALGAGADAQRPRDELGSDDEAGHRAMAFGRAAERLLERAVRPVAMSGGGRSVRHPPSSTCLHPDRTSPAPRGQARAWIIRRRGVILLGHIVSSRSSLIAR